MAGPLNGIGGQQQLPVSNTSQPGGQNTNQALREREDAQPQENVVQPQSAPAADVQNTETGNQDILQGRIADALAQQGDTAEAELRRGSLLDIEV